MNRKILFILVFLIGMCLQSGARGQEVEPMMQVTGRLALEKQNAEELLILHSADGLSYILTGELKEQLKNSWLELGEKNLASLSGTLGEKDRLYCEEISSYEPDETGERKLKSDAVCIRYLFLDVSQIISTAKSEEIMPPPKRETEAEERLKQKKSKTMPYAIIGEIYGNISEASLNSPIKSITVVNQNKNSPIRELTLLITSDTRVAKRNSGDDNPYNLAVTSLKTGQKVAAMYSKDDLKASALTVTILKEE